MIFGKQNKFNNYKVYTDELKKVLGQIKVNGKNKGLYLIIRNELHNANILWYNTLPDNKRKPEGLYREAVYYQINPNLLEESWTRVTLNLQTQSKITKAIAQCTVELSDVYANIEKSLNLITITPQARHYTDLCHKYSKPLKNKKKGYFLIKNRNFEKINYNYWLTAIDCIENKDWGITVDSGKTGRVFNILTNTPKELRPYLRINGKKIVELDIANAQPTIFIKYLLNWCDKKHIPHNSPDIQNYIQLCQTGTFYKKIERMILEAEEEINIEAGQFKTEFFGKVFFSSEKRLWKWRKIFDMNFPNVSKAITEAKNHHHRDLAIHLQKDESDYIIMDVCTKLFNKGINEFFPLHDAIYCTEDIADIIYAQMMDSATSRGFMPTIKKKELKTPLCAR